MIGWHKPEVALDPKYPPIAAEPISSQRWDGSVVADRYAVKRPCVCAGE